MKRTLARFIPALLAAAAFVAVSTATRVALAMRPEIGLSGIADWTRVFGYGLLFDVVAAFYVAAPFVLWLALVPDRVARSWPHRTLALFGFAALLF